MTFVYAVLFGLLALSAAKPMNNDLDEIQQGKGDKIKMEGDAENGPVFYGGTHFHGGHHTHNHHGNHHFYGGNHNHHYVHLLTEDNGDLRPLITEKESEFESGGDHSYYHVYVVVDDNGNLRSLTKEEETEVLSWPRHVDSNLQNYVQVESVQADEPKDGDLDDGLNNRRWSVRVHVHHRGFHGHFGYHHHLENTVKEVEKENSSEKRWRVHVHLHHRGFHGHFGYHHHLENTVKEGEKENSAEKRWRVHVHLHHRGFHGHFGYHHHLENTVKEGEKENSAEKGSNLNSDQLEDTANEKEKDDATDNRWRIHVHIHGHSEDTVKEAVPDNSAENTNEIEVNDLEE